MDNTTLPDFDALWNYGKPADTEAAFRQIQEQLGADAPETYRLELETQIARTLGLQRKFEDAHRVLDGVEPRVGEGMGRCRVRYLLERGRVTNSSGRKQEAQPFFEEAWELGRQIGEDGFAVDAAHMVAIVAAPDAALQWNLSALELATSSDMPSARKWRKSLHNNIGWTFFEMQKFDLAMFHFTKCREYSEEAGDAESERIARWSIAKTHRLQGQAETALEMQQAQLAELEREGRTGGFVFEELAECLLALGRTVEAAPYFGKAYDALSQDPWLREDEPARIERLLTLSGRADGDGPTA